MKSESDKFKKSVYDGLQLAYKITANSLYGQLGSRIGALYYKELAASTTAVGRKQLEIAQEYVEDKYHFPMILDNGKKIYLHNDVVYGDTDSIFIKSSRKTNKDNELTKLEAVQHCIDCGQKAGKYITDKLKEDNWPSKYWNEDKTSPHFYPQDLEYEKTFWPFILISKKRYTGEKYEFSSKEIPKRTSMGLVTKRRDNAPIVKYVFGNMVNRLMSATKVDDVVKWLRDTLDNIVGGKEHISMFILSKTLNSYYKNPQSIPHKVLADRIGERDPGNKPKANDRIPYAYIEIPKEMGLIVRTAGSNKTKNEIDHDLGTLKNTWNQIKENPKVTLSIDTYYWGFLFFRVEQENKMKNQIGL